jgi:hypothetical protein
MRFLVLLTIIVSLSQLATADEAQPTVDQLRKEFSAELALAKILPPNERRVAILHLKVSKVERVGHCRGRTSGCGLNPTCGHTGTKVDVVSYTVLGEPINDDKLEVPKTVTAPCFKSLNGSRFKVGDQVWGAYDVYRGGSRLLSPRKITVKP